MPTTISPTSRGSKFVLSITACYNIIIKWDHRKLSILLLRSRRLIIICIKYIYIWFSQLFGISTFKTAPSKSSGRVSLKPPRFALHIAVRYALRKWICNYIKETYLKSIKNQISLFSAKMIFKSVYVSEVQNELSYATITISSPKAACLW